MSLFKNVVSQRIDSSGKTRMLTFKTGQKRFLSLMTSPLPPLDLPTDSTIYSTTIPLARRFTNMNHFQITMQDGDEDDNFIQGIWVKGDIAQNNGIYYGFIPIITKDSYPLQNVVFAPDYLNDPLRTESFSRLEQMYFVRKVSDFLKQYTLFEYARNAQNALTEKRKRDTLQDFSKNRFVVIGDWNYSNILSLQKKLEYNNDTLYHDGKLVVPSKIIKKKLINFLKVQLLNDRKGVFSYAQRHTIKDYYRTLSDFRKSENQLIFLSRESIMLWLNGKSKMTNMRTVSTELHPDITEPYFYKNHAIRKGKLNIIQNVEDGFLERALAVCDKWEKDRINRGFYTSPFEGVEKNNFCIYTSSGVEEGPEKSGRCVLKYEDGVYAAILFV